MNQEYQAFIEKVKQTGGKLLSFQCPICCKEVETLAAPDGATWDTLATCPHCEGTFFKVATTTTVKATVLEGDVQWQK